MTGQPRYGLHISVDDALLLDMARIIDASYTPGAFEEAIEAFYETDEDEVRWYLRGTSGEFSALIERGESLLQCSLSTEGAPFEDGKQLMWKRYLAVGGNPEKARKP